jgi:hypothetical protein
MFYIYHLFVVLPDFPNLLVPEGMLESSGRSTGNMQLM